MSAHKSGRCEALLAHGGSCNAVTSSPYDGSASSFTLPCCRPPTSTNSSRPERETDDYGRRDSDWPASWGFPLSSPSSRPPSPIPTTPTLAALVYALAHPPPRCMPCMPCESGSGSSACVLATATGTHRHPRQNTRRPGTPRQMDACVGRRCSRHLPSLCLIPACRPRCFPVTEEFWHTLLFPMVSNRLRVLSKDPLHYLTAPPKILSSE